MIFHDLLSQVGGTVAGMDDPSVLEAFLNGRDTTDVLAQVIHDQGERRDEALEAFLTPHAATIVIHDRHPGLAQIVAWVEACEIDGGVLLLASPAGPPPPAVLVLEENPG